MMCIYFSKYSVIITILQVSAVSLSSAVPVASVYPPPHDALELGHALMEVTK